MKYLFSVLLVLFSLSSFAKGITDYKIDRSVLVIAHCLLVKRLISTSEKSDQNSEYKESVLYRIMLSQNTQ